MTLFRAEHALDGWFDAAVGVPTSIQRSAWPVLRRGEHALLIASTGQGKSLAAWRPVVERLADRPAVGNGVRALHIAPLKALARDMTHNLAPLLAAASEASGRPLTMGLRCGDTPADERRRQRRSPPDMLSTTPESLFVLLGSRGGRELLRAVETVVIDEWHALAGNKRGAHLALSLARLDRLTGRRVQRVALSATAHPTEEMARYLVGEDHCEIIEPDPPGAVDLCVELPGRALGSYPDPLHWQEIHHRLVDLSQGTTAMLVFCQTRAQVERTAAALDELLSAAGHPDQVGAHHGSLDTAYREAIEARFKAGGLRVLVSSASLELGLDLGHVDRVCQIGVPGSVNLLRQRAGRSCHRPGGQPCMHLFPLTLNQLVECSALADVLDRRVIEAVHPLDGPDDVLAQHLVAMVAEGISGVDEMLAVVRRAWPSRSVGKEDLERLLDMLGDAPELMPAGQVLPLVRRVDGGRFHSHPDAARLVLTNAGTIPEWFEYQVVRADTGEMVGRLDEEFAFESSPGQVLQLGRRNWRILYVLPGEVRVEPAAADEAAELPFWFGEGPGRSREMVSAMLDTIGGEDHGKLHPQAAAMLAESRALLGVLPGSGRIVVERFADPGGDRHVVVHTFAGARINRAWGLALRKCFCRQFNFELQAAATDDGILISLGVTSQFDTRDIVNFVHSKSVRTVLTQALLDTPMFLTRFRWCANTALVLLKNGLGGKVPAQRQRSQAENLVACVFPDQLACLENLSGPREVPDHPLVQQALTDCLDDYMAASTLTTMLRCLEEGEIEVHAVDTPRPSPLAEALIHAPQHSYLDEADAEERRTRNFEQPPKKRPRPVPAAMPGSGGPARRSVGDAVPKVATPIAGLAGIRPSVDVLEELLESVGFLTQREGETGIGLAAPVPAGGWSGWFAQLVREGRAATLCGESSAERLWVCTARLDWFSMLDPGLRSISAPCQVPRDPPPGSSQQVREWLLDARARIGCAESAGLVERLFPG
jgi:ATP-dependent helicase Lhr and Lhr-like helicase